MRYVPLLLIASQAAAMPRLELVGDSDASTVHVRGTALDGPAEAPYFTATWSLAPGGAELFFEQRRMEADGSNLRVAPLLEAGIMAYLEGRIRFTKQGTQCAVPLDALLADMDHIVQATTTVFAGAGHFPGFSAATAMQLERLIALDWSHVRNGVFAAGEQDKYLVIYRFLRQQQDLFIAELHTDLGRLSNVVVWGDAPADLPPSMPTICGTVFDSKEFLCALDLSATDDGAAKDVQLAPATWASMLPTAPMASPEDRSFAEQLAVLKERLDRLEATRDEFLAARLEDVEAAIEDLRLELRSASSFGNGTGTEAPLATVRFQRNSDVLDPTQYAVIDAVIDDLLADDRTVRVTGFADATGDPVLNLALSERRALAVRGYLVQRGLPLERSVVVAEGDRASNGRAPMQRRVEVDWSR